MNLYLLMFLASVQVQAAILFQDGFESGDSSAFYDKSSSNWSVISTQRHTGNYALQVNPAEQTSSFVAANLNLWNGPELWITAWVKFPVGFNFNTHIYKFIIVESNYIAPPADGNRYFANLMGGTFHLSTENTFDSAGYPVSIRPQADGQWHKLEWGIHRVFGDANGRFEFYWDDVKADVGTSWLNNRTGEDATTCPSRKNDGSPNTSCMPLRDVKFGAYANDGAVPENRVDYWDDLVISTTRLGATGAPPPPPPTTTPPPPPPPPVGQNYFQEGFEDASLAQRGFYDNTAPRLTSAEKYSGSMSAEFRFLAGQQNAVQGGAIRHKIPETDSVYLSYRIKHSANWTGSNKTYHPHQFHFMTNENDDWAGPSFSRMTAYVEDNEGIPLIAIQDGQNIDQARAGQNLVNVTESRAAAGCNGDSDGLGAGNCYQFGTNYYNGKELRASGVYFSDSAGSRYKGDWHHVEAFFKLNSIVNGKGITDGVMQYWYDGQLIIDHRSVLLRTGAHAGMKWNQFLLAPHIGDGSPIDQTFWVDDLVVASVRPGSTTGDTTAPGAPNGLALQ